MHIALFQFNDKPNPVYQIIAGELRERGHRVWWGSLNQARQVQWHDGQRVVAIVPGPAALPAALLRLPLLASMLNRLVFLAFMLRLRAFFGQHQPDIVQVNTSSLFWLWVLPLFQPDTMHFLMDFRQINQRETSSPIRRLQNAWENLVRRIIISTVYDRACFCHAAGAKKILGEQWAKRASVVPVGVKPHFLTAPHPASSSAADEQSVRFIYIGTINSVRKLERIVLAAQQVRAHTEQFELVLIGPDVNPGYYQRMIRDLGLEQTVRIEPPVPYERIPDVLLHYDVALAYVPDMPVDWHYYPTLKVLEYRALGLPIIASDNEPNRDIVQDGINGLIVQNTAEDIARGMLRFVGERAFLESCRAHAQQMRQGTQWGEVVSMYEALYHSLKRNNPLPLEESTSATQISKS